MNRSLIDTWMDDTMDVTSSSNLLSYQLSDRKLHFEKRLQICSVTRRLTKRRDDRWTHQFQIHVKSRPEAELASYVQRVVFCFCDSCSNRISMADGPPFMADGYFNVEFPVRVTLLFRDRHQTCIILHHMLSLNSPQDGAAEDHEQETEHLISFVNPSTRMQKFLNEPPVVAKLATASSATKEHQPPADDKLEK